MSQYNLNGFNRSPYNIKPEYNVTWLNCTFAEKITGSFGTASDDYLTINANERVSFEGKVTPVRFQRGTGTETITANVNVDSLFYLTAQTMSEAVTCPVIASSIIVHPEATANVSLTGQLACGFELQLDNTIAETIDADTWIGVIQSLPVAEGYELLSAVTGAEAVTEYVCNLACQLAPGSFIVIDANNYNVLIDGENAIWTQSGDWLDNLNRETMSITIQAASGGSGLTATVLYTERYL